MTRASSSYRSITAAALAALVFAAGCRDSTGPDHEDEPHAVRLTIGTQVVTVDESGNVTGGPIVIPVGQTPISAQFLADDGDVLTLNPAEYELRVIPVNAAVVTFTPTGGFAGTLTGVAAGNTSLTIQLWHIPAGHDDFEQLVPVTVQ